nr:hypothetical protein [Tanacetum cinerariifolium]
MVTLTEHIIVVGAQNRLLILEKLMYDSWASRMRLFIKGKKHGRMMIDSIDNGPLVYPTVEENWQTRPMKCSELTEAQQLQDDCDVQATNIILHGLPPDVYALVNHHEAAKDIWDMVKLLMKGIELSYQEPEARKAGQILDEEQLAFLAEPGISNAPVSHQTIPQNLAFQNEDLDAYDSDCDDSSSAKAVLMADLLSCDPEVLFERTTSDAITAGAWGFEHTKACFVTEIIPFLKVLKDTFNAFDRTLLDEITEVQTVFNQMKEAVDQSSVDKNVFEIQIQQ